MYTYKQYSSFFFDHTHIKLIKRNIKKKPMSTVNRNYWVTPSFVSHGFGLRPLIVEQTDLSIIRHQNCFYNELTMFAGILLKTFWYLYKLTMKMKTVSKRQWQTSVRGYQMMCLPIYHLIINKDLPVKNIVFTTHIHYLWKSLVQIWKTLFCTSLYIFMSNLLHKKSWGQIFTK